jgi:hypothetical protein
MRNPKGLNDKLSKCFFLNTNTYFFFSNSDTLLFSELKSLSEFIKKVVFPFEKKNFDSLTLKPLGLYVN